MSRQSWSDHILGFYICQSCEFIDRDSQRTQVGYPCPRCNVPSPGGLRYFALPIPTVGDLIGELHPLPELDAPDPTVAIPIPESHQFALLVFFCTLAEVLLQHFIQRYMASLSIPRPIQDKLLADNKGTRRRIDTLFPALVGVKWKDAVSHVSARSGTDYSATMGFAAEAAEKRNLVLHLGNQWAMPPEMPERCFTETATLIRFFVELHNSYLARPPVQAGTPAGMIPAA